MSSNEASGAGAQFHGKDFLALMGGLALLVGAFAVIPQLPGWIDRWGTVTVYLTYFLLMSIAGRLFWKGADTLWAVITTTKGHPSSSPTPGDDLIPERRR